MHLQNACQARASKDGIVLVPLVSMTSYKKVFDAARNTGLGMASEDLFSIKVCHDPNTTTPLSLKVVGHEAEGWIKADLLDSV